jgi:hypothetical protein
MSGYDVAFAKPPICPPTMTDNFSARCREFRPLKKVSKYNYRKFHTKSVDTVGRNNFKKGFWSRFFL